MGTISIISIIVAMNRVLRFAGNNETMGLPADPVSPHAGNGYWGSGIIMLLSSLFFWPSPAVALVGNRHAA
ncbi:hypothetical protein [Paenibacillus zanthoxyli]|uniref:hypothetical protein n=1 Tax=Paenibacillus zanthoxyli TaxID=369399 RepID=UPI000470B15B